MLYIKTLNADLFLRIACHYCKIDRPIYLLFYC